MNGQQRLDDHLVTEKTSSQGNWSRKNHPHNIMKRTYSGLNLNLSLGSLNVANNSQEEVDTKSSNVQVSSVSQQEAPVSEDTDTNITTTTSTAEPSERKKKEIRESIRIEEMTRDAMKLVQQKMEAQNVLTLEEASKILSVLPSAALGALTAPRYIGQGWFEVIAPDRHTSYFYNTEESRVAITRPEKVSIDKTKMLITELNRRRREDFYVKSKMAAAEGLLQSQLRKQYGQQILREEREKVMTRRASEAAMHTGFKNIKTFTENMEKKENQAMQHLIHEFDPRGQKLISFEMFKAGVVKISDSKLYNTNAGVLLKLTDDQMQYMFLELAGEDAVLTIQEFEEFTKESRPPAEPPMIQELWDFLNRVKAEMKDENKGDGDEGMENSIVRQLTYEMRARARSTIVKSFRELEPVFYWGFIDLDLIANIDDHDFSMNKQDEKERASKLRRLREQKKSILRNVKSQNFVSTSIQPIFFVGNLNKRANSGAWLLRQFTLTGEGILQSQKVKRLANDTRSSADLIEAANREALLASGKESGDRSGSGNSESKTVKRISKDKFRLDPTISFNEQVATTGDLDFTLVRGDIRLRATHSSSLDEWIANLRALHVLLRQQLVEDELKSNLADARRRMADHQTVKAHFFDKSLRRAQEANLSGQNKTVREIQDLQKFLYRLEGLQTVIYAVTKSRSIDNLLDGIYTARGVPQDSDVMLEAQELMEQLTVEKNAEIALKLAAKEQQKKQLQARRLLLEDLLDVFMTDNFNQVQKAISSYRNYCINEGIGIGEEMIELAQNIGDSLQHHVNTMINDAVDAVLTIENFPSNVETLPDESDGGNELLDDASPHLRLLVNTICVHLSKEDVFCDALILEKVVGCRNEYNIQQQDKVVQSVHSNNLTVGEDESVGSLAQHRDRWHKFSVGQEVKAWHGISDYLEVQAQMNDCAALGIPSDSKIVMLLSLLNHCLKYLREARKNAIPCSDTFKVLRSNHLDGEEDYYLFDDTPLNHAFNYMTLPEFLAISDFGLLRETIGQVVDIMQYLDGCHEAAVNCGLTEDSEGFYRLSQTLEDLNALHEHLERRQQLSKSLEETVDLISNGSNCNRWIPAIVVKNQWHNKFGDDGNGDDDDNDASAKTPLARRGSLLVEFAPDLQLEDVPKMLSVPRPFLRTRIVGALCNKGYFEEGAQVCFRKDKDAWSNGNRQTITITKVDVPRTWQDVDVQVNPDLRLELAFHVKYTAKTWNGASLSSIKAENLEILPDSQVANLQKGDTVFVSHTFLHLPVLQTRMADAKASGLDESIDTFVHAQQLRDQLRHDYILTKSALKLIIAKFPYVNDAYTGLKSSTDTITRATTERDFKISDEDRDLLTVADRYMEIIAARKALRRAMLDASKLRNPLELKRALEQAISFGVNPTSALCKSAKQLMHTFVGENSKIKAEQQLQKVCEASYPILPDICLKLQTALFVGVNTINSALINKATTFLMDGLSRQKVDFSVLFKVIHQPTILSFLNQFELNALLVNREFYDYIMRHSYFYALKLREVKLHKPRQSRQTRQTRQKQLKNKCKKTATKPNSDSSDSHGPIPSKKQTDPDSPPAKVTLPFGFGSSQPRFEDDNFDYSVSPSEKRKIELEQIRRAREKLLRELWF